MLDILDYKADIFVEFSDHHLKTAPLDNRTCPVLRWLLQLIILAIAKIWGYCENLKKYIFLIYEMIFIGADPNLLDKANWNAKDHFMKFYKIKCQSTDPEDRVNYGQ